MKNNNSQITANPIPNIPHPPINNPLLATAYNQFAEFCPDYEICDYSHDSVTYTRLNMKYTNECGVLVHRHFCVGSDHPNRLLSYDLKYEFINSETGELIAMFWA